MPYDAPVTKELPIGVRFEPEEIAALRAWAKEDQRPVSQLIRKLAIDAARAAGKMPQEAPNVGPKGTPGL